MADLETTFGARRRTATTIRVEPEEALRLTVGSRWVVVSSSKESLWDGAYTVTLEQIEHESAER